VDGSNQNFEKLVEDTRHTVPNWRKAPLVGLEEEARNLVV